MKNISPAELKEWIEAGKTFTLVDVREGWEREAFNIGGIHIPTAEVAARKAEIPDTGDVVVYCAKGVRSGIIIQRLEKLGYKNLFNLAGGMTAWK